MILKGAQILDKNFCFIQKDIKIKGTNISEISRNIKINPNDTVIDLNGHIILPGFIDQHIHGCVAKDICDTKIDSIMRISKYLAQNAVTSFCPTTMTLPFSQLTEIFSNIEKCMNIELPGAYIHGINMEGPFISPHNNGSQNEKYISKPDYEMFLQLNRNNIVKLIDIAPEIPGAMEFIQKASQICTVSAAHSNATYREAMISFKCGISQVTHLFNAMSGLHHRNPGLAAATLDSPSVKAEIICDGIHVDPAILRLAFKILGENRSIIISDSLPASGCPDGEQMLGDQKIFIKDQIAKLKNGTIAGSTSNLLKEFHNALNWGVPFRQVVKSLTENPARQLKVFDKTGSIEVGKFADLIVLDKNFNLKSTIIKGRKVC